MKRFDYSEAATAILNQAANNLVSRIRETERTNAVAFARRAGISPDAWQADVLQTNAGQVILNCSRQSGKSTTTAILASHKAIYEPGSLTLLIAPTERQSSELLRTVRGVFDALPDAPSFTTDSILRLETIEGSRIIALPSNEANIRGFSGANLLIVDEASRCNDQLYFAIRPMLAVSGGRIILLSSPFGKRGFFHDVWTNGENWQRVEITADMCPRISPEFLAAERRALPEFVYLQEYFCKFVDSEMQIFSSDDIQAALDDSLNVIAW